MRGATLDSRQSDWRGIMTGEDANDGFFQGG
jgi:hypothetical protein